MTNQTTLHLDIPFPVWENLFAFTAPKDLRLPLRGYVVEVEAEHAYLMASDGATLAAFRFPAAGHKDGHCAIPRVFIETTIAGVRVQIPARDRKLYPLRLEVDRANETCRADTLNGISSDLVKGSFGLLRVRPSSALRNAHERAHYNFNLLAKFEKLLGKTLLTKDKDEVFAYLTPYGKDATGVIASPWDENFFGLVMPLLRDGSTAPDFAFRS